MMTKKLVVPVLLAAALVACEREAEAPAAPGVVPPGDARQPDAFIPADTLPPTRSLDVSVEGQTEAREARLFKSRQGYAIYVLPQLEMTPEEPCCDLAYARVDDGFFMRIERIDDSADLATLRDDMALALSSVGEASEAALHEFAEPGVDVELSMRATGDGVSMVILVARIDGGRYRVTQHLPHREALEGIPASMWAMLGSLRTTGPRPGMAVRAARKAHGLTQAELAGLAATGPRFVSELERGKPSAEMGKVLDVLAVLGLRLVLEGTGT